MSLVEAGESRTPQLFIDTTSNNTTNRPRPSTGNVLAFSLGNPTDTGCLDSDPAKLLPQLLDQLVSLGQVALQLQRALGGNSHSSVLKLRQLSADLDTT